jgi:hydroxyacylglutathione hydrolase
VPSSTVGYEKRFNSALLTALNDGEEAFVTSILTGQPEPPLYFARMKRDNKLGPAVLHGLPRPGKLQFSEIPTLLGATDNVFLDARLNRKAFFKSHLRGSLYVPLGGKFNTVAGSFVTEEQTIYLLLERESDLDEAVRQLVRVGLDRIGGYALLEEVLQNPLCRDCVVSTESASTADLAAQKQEHPDAVVLDVRTNAEHSDGLSPGSVNIAYTRLLDRIGEVPPGPTYLVHCGSGLRAAFAVSLLERLGRDVIYLDGPVEALLDPPQP